MIAAASSLTAVDLAPDLGPFELGCAALLLGLNAAASLALQLGLGRKLLWGAMRALVQLSILGFVLEFVFELQSPLVVLLLMISMGTMAGWEAVRRSRHRLRGLFPISAFAMLSSSILVTMYAVAGALGTEWSTPRFAIPILGMLLGNGLNGVSLGLDAALAGFLGDRQKIEVLLAHGATPAEARREVVRRAMRTGLIPILNAMAASGVIAIPGMMTGQLLAGANPEAAVRYQIFILFCIAGTVALGTLGAVLGAAHLLFDKRGRLRTERIRSRES